MKVVVKPIVRAKVNAFYKAAMVNHPLLTEDTIAQKKTRMFKKLHVLEYMQGFGKARVKSDWIMKDWHEVVIEDFHFAYEVVKDENGEPIVIVCDALHSLNYH